MKKILANILPKIFFILIIIELIYAKSVLEAYNITKGKCDKELNRYIFDINALLNGNISSQSIIESFIIKSNDNNLDIKCDFPEILIPVEKKDILIKCSINNSIYSQFISMYFEGSNNYLDLIDFNEKILYIDNAYCPHVNLRITSESDFSEEESFEDDYTSYYQTDDITSVDDTNCIESNPNCNKCDGSGNCIECKEGSYPISYPMSTDILKCEKCLPTCENCKSLNECTKCESGYILSQNICVSCFSIKEGCEKCSNMSSCDKCYNNNFFEYTLNNGECYKKKGLNNTDTKIKLKYERIDGYIQNESKINFKIHFILLENYLSGAILTITATIRKNNLLTDIRHLDTEQISFTCEQYGDAFGNINKDNGGYLVNFLCSIDNPNNDISSIIFEKITINNDNVNENQLENLKNKDFTITEIIKESLDEIYIYNYNFNKLTIKKVTDAILKEELTFNIVADFDAPTTHERNYEIKLNNESGGMISAMCEVPIMNILEDKKISCYSSKDNINEKLSFVQGMYTSREDPYTQLIVNDNDVTIDVTIEVSKRKTLSVLAIVGITIAGIFLVGPFIFYLVKFFLKKKENYNNAIFNDDDKNERRRNNADNSKEVIFN